jgi:plasmid stability protein
VGVIVKKPGAISRSFGFFFFVAFLILSEGRFGPTEESSRHFFDINDIIDYFAISMASITIRNLEPQLKSKLRIRAAEHDRSMEEEVRVILKSVLAEETSMSDLATRIRNRFRDFGGIELEPVVREPIREFKGLGE